LVRKEKKKGESADAGLSKEKEGDKDCTVLRSDTRLRREREGKKGFLFVVRCKGEGPFIRLPETEFDGGRKKRRPWFSAQGDPKRGKRFANQYEHADPRGTKERGRGGLVWVRKKRFFWGKGDSAEKLARGLMDLECRNACVKEKREKGKNRDAEINKDQKARSTSFLKIGDMEKGKGKKGESTRRKKVVNATTGITITFLLIMAKGKRKTQGNSGGDSCWGKCGNCLILTTNPKHEIAGGKGKKRRDWSVLIQRKVANKSARFLHFQKRKRGGGGKSRLSKEDEEGGVSPLGLVLLGEEGGGSELSQDRRGTPRHSRA